MMYMVCACYGLVQSRNVQCNVGIPTVQDNYSEPSVGIEDPSVPLSTGPQKSKV